MEPCRALLPCHQSFRAEGRHAFPFTHAFTIRHWRGPFDLYKRPSPLSSWSVCILGLVVLQTFNPDIHRTPLICCPIAGIRFPTWHSSFICDPIMGCSGPYWWCLVCLCLLSGLSLWLLSRISSITMLVKYCLLHCFGVSLYQFALQMMFFPFQFPFLLLTLKKLYMA